jgi:hypothetical protein
VSVAQTTLQRGGCHCGAVRFEVDVPLPPVVYDCNCSMCSKAGYLHLIVPARAFRLLSGEAMLATYTFGTGVAQHRFCRVCGVKSFYVPRSNPDGFSVNLRCLDDPALEGIKVEHFDGRNWEANAPSLGRLLRESD